VALVAVGSVAGCSSSYLQTGDPGWWASDVVKVNPEAFDHVKPGMSRGEVRKMLGAPTDVSKTVMHWRTSEWGDAWVFFDPTGKLVTGKYRQDEETLRLADVPSYED
jgi:hypothetical protein